MICCEYCWKRFSSSAMSSAFFASNSCSCSLSCWSLALFPACICKAKAKEFQWRRCKVSDQNLLRFGRHYHLHSIEVLHLSFFFSDFLNLSLLLLSKYSVSLFFGLQCFLGLLPLYFVLLLLLLSLVKQFALQTWWNFVSNNMDFSTQKRHIGGYIYRGNTLDVSCSVWDTISSLCTLMDFNISAFFSSSSSCCCACFASLSATAFAIFCSSLTACSCCVTVSLFMILSLRVWASL